MAETQVNQKELRTGGAYIPPVRLARLNINDQVFSDRSSEAYQKLTWEALKKSINGLINKVNVSNIQNIIIELFGENLIRGRGLLARSILKAQSASLPFTPVFASLISVLNSKIPMIGELILSKIILQFRRSYRRNDKTQCLASVTFLAHLVNQQVAHEIVALELLTLLLERPTDDSVEIAVGFTKECGAKLIEISPKPMNIIFERFRVILIEAQIDVRVQWMIQVLFQVRKDKFKDNPALKPELDLVDEKDRITHCISLDDSVIDSGLVVFRYDLEYLDNEFKYASIKHDILGDTSLMTAEEPEVEPEEPETIVKQLEIKDRTNVNLISLRKTIYLTIMSSLSEQETCHKLLKIHIPEGLEIEMANMVAECCSQEKTYTKYYGNLAERFCKLDPTWTALFEACFKETFTTIHRVETNRIRNLGKLFAHLLWSDAIPWTNLSMIKLNEEETTSASRIFIKILLLELAEVLGIKKLKEKLFDPLLGDHLQGMFPKDVPRDTRFAINFYTAIGLGPLTDELRDWLKNVVEAAPVEDFEDKTYTSEGKRKTYESESDSYNHSLSPPRKRK